MTMKTAVTFAVALIALALSGAPAMANFPQASMTITPVSVSSGRCPGSVTFSATVVPSAWSASELAGATYSFRSGGVSTPNYPLSTAAVREGVQSMTDTRTFATSETIVETLTVVSGKGDATLNTSLAYHALCTQTVTVGNGPAPENCTPITKLDINHDYADSGYSQYGWFTQYLNVWQAPGYSWIYNLVDSFSAHCEIDEPGSLPLMIVLEGPSQGGSLPSQEQCTAFKISTIDIVKESDGTNGLVSITNHLIRFAKYADAERAKLFLLKLQAANGEVRNCYIPGFEMNPQGPRVYYWR